MPIGPRRVAVLLGTVLLASSVASCGSQDAGAPAESPPETVVKPPPREPRPGADGDEPAPAEPAEPVYGGLPKYQDRCENLDEHGGRADVVYEKHREMTRGDTATVKAAVTLDLSVPPEKVLPSTGTVAEDQGLLVSCNVQARLSAAEDEFEIDQTDWRGQSLLTTDTARWAWFVKP